MLKAILIDDEYYALQGLKAQLNKLGTVDVVGLYEDADEGLAGVKTGNPDVVFLDINMGCKNGLDLFATLTEYNPKLYIVFVTAYEQYAVDAFELDALDYIVKPVRLERLKKTLNRIEKQRSLTTKTKRIAIECFGGLSIKQDGIGVTVPWRTKKAEEILAFIALKKGDFVSKEKVAAMLWWEQDLEKSKSNFYLAFHYLQKNLREVGIEPPVESIKNKIRLKTEDVALDILEFEQEINRGDISSLQKAKNLYKGTLFDGMYFEWSHELAVLYEDLHEKLLKK